MSRSRDLMEKRQALARRPPRTLAAMSQGGERAYWERRLGEAFSLDGVGWRGLGEPYNRWMYRVRRRLILRRMSPLLPTGPFDVLDVGSGTGFYIERWRELGARSITGSDITDVAVERLRNRFPGLTFVQLDIGGQLGSLEGRQFDVVSAMDVLYHIVDDVAYHRSIQNLGQLVRPGGLLVLTENFLHRPAVRAEVQVSRSLEEIEQLLGRAGFVLVERRPVFVLMNTPIDSSRRLHQGAFGVLARVLGRWPRVGGTIGATLAPIEVALASLLHEGPSTEMMVCRQRADSRRPAR